MELDKIEKITLKDFGQRLAALLHTKNGGYNSIAELIDDFWDYNGFCPDNKAVLLGFASLQQLLKSKEMFEYVNVLTTTNEKGERVNVYVGRHRDDLNALTQARRLGFQEMERRQENKRFWIEERNRVVKTQKENVRPNGTNQNYERCRNAQDKGQNACNKTNQMARGNTFSIFRSPRQPPSNFNSAKLIRTLEEIRDDERRQQQLKQQKMLNIEKESRKISKKDVATETELNKTYDKRSNTSTRLNDISEQPEEANLIDLSSPNVTRASLKMVEEILFFGQNDERNGNESVSDLIRFSTKNSSRLECEVERNSGVNSLNNIDIQDAFNSFMEDRIENLNEDEISGDFSSILKEFLVFDNDESIASNKQQQLQKKTNNNKIAIAGKDSAIYMWDRKYFKRCPKCPLRQTLEHVMLVNHQRFEESFKEIEDEEVENGEEEGEEFNIDENSGNFSGGQRNDGGNLIFEQEEEYDENNEENNIVEESDLVNNNNEEENGWELVEDENNLSGELFLLEF
uniref:HTH OST-type domain-containing protein n=1 Tax=Meloidogyne floridensis TaxID=298350 RepID=A0A915NFP9_9BILA